MGIFNYNIGNIQIYSYTLIINSLDLSVYGSFILHISELEIIFLLNDICFRLHCGMHPYSTVLTPLQLSWFSERFNFSRYLFFIRPSLISFAFISDKLHPTISRDLNEPLFVISSWYMSLLQRSGCVTDFNPHLSRVILFKELFLSRTPIILKHSNWQDSINIHTKLAFLDNALMISGMTSLGHFNLIIQSILQLIVWHIYIRFLICYSLCSLMNYP